MKVSSKPRSVVLFALTVFFAFVGAAMVIEGRQSGWAVSLMACVTAIFFSISLPVAQPQSQKCLLITKQYPEPIIFKGRRARNLLVALASFAIASIFFAGLLSAPTSMGSVVLYAVLTVIFGVAALVLVAAVIKPNRLIMDSEGLVFTTFFHVRRWQWQDVQDFKAITSVSHAKRVINVKEIIGFNDRNATSKTRTNRLRTQLGVTAIIPNHFGISDIDLADTLNSWRARAVSGKSQ